MKRVYATLIIWGIINLIAVGFAVMEKINPIIVSFIFLFGYIMILIIGACLILKEVLKNDSIL